MLLEKRQKLVMIGDSITDCGRSQPAGEGLFDALGRGYVSLVDALLGSCYPELGIRVVNKGNGGNTVRDLKSRWQTDVIDQAPDWLTIMIGTNDVWRQFDTPYITEGHVYAEEYRATLTELVHVAKPHVKGLVLFAPFYMEPNRADGMRAAMDQYGAIVKEVAAESGAMFVDTQAAFDTLLRHVYPATIGWDRVHPNQTGHMLIARAFLDAVGFQWPG